MTSTSSTGSGAPMPDPSLFLGCKLNLISNADIRYEGTLSKYDGSASTITLQHVQSFGTEQRRRDVIPPSTELFDIIIFRGADIKELEVTSPPKLEIPRSRTNSITDDSAVIKCVQAQKPLNFTISPTARAWYARLGGNGAKNSFRQQGGNANNNSRRGRGQGSGGRGGRGSGTGTNNITRHGGTDNNSSRPGINNVSYSRRKESRIKDEYQNVPVGYPSSGEERSALPEHDAEALDELCEVTYRFDLKDKIPQPDKRDTLAMEALPQDDTKVFYEPDEFYDHISCEAKVVNGVPPKTLREKAKLDAETFNLSRRRNRSQQSTGRRGQSGQGQNVVAGRNGNMNGLGGGAGGNNNRNNTNNNNNRVGGQGKQQQRSGVFQRQGQNTRNGQQQGGRGRGSRFGGIFNGNRQDGLFVPNRQFEQLLQLLGKGGPSELGFNIPAGKPGTSAATQWTFPSSGSSSDENNGDFDVVDRFQSGSGQSGMSFA